MTGLRNSGDRRKSGANVKPTRRLTLGAQAQQAEPAASMSLDGFDERHADTTASALRMDVCSSHTTHAAA